MPLNVKFTDPTGVLTAKADLLVKDMQAAWAMWSSYLAPSSASLEVDFHIVSGYANRGGGRALATSPEVTSDNKVTAAAGSVFELRTGQDPNGESPDIEVFFDGDFLTKWYWIDPLDGSTKPPNMNNLVEVIAHELGHALGFNGFSDWATYALGSYGTRFDRLIQIQNGLPYFVGEQAMALYGGAVPLTAGNVFHVGNTTTPLNTDLMNGLVFRTDVRYLVSALDVAILSDMGTATILSDKLLGSPKADVINGGAGNDEIQGFAGDDLIEGGLGADTAIYAAASESYAWSKDAKGNWIVRDLRTGAPEGVDTLHGVEMLKFSDKTVTLTSTSPVAIAAGALLRGAQADFVTDLEAKVVSGAQTLTTAVATLVKGAAQTTSVATLSYLFFTGKIPGDAGLDYLVSPEGPNSANLNSDYFQAFNLENRFINFAVNLGKVGEGQAQFQAKYGALSLFEATREAYRTIFGAAPTDARTHALIDGREAYFASYGGDGLGGLGTKAAMVGWLLAEAVKADVGVMARSNDAWLMDVSDGSAPFAINILDPSMGYYKSDFIFGGA